MGRIIVDTANAEISMPNDEVFVKKYIDSFVDNEDATEDQGDYAKLINPPFVLIPQQEYLEMEDDESEIPSKSIERYESMLTSVPVSMMPDDGEPEVYAINIENPALPNVVTVTILDTEPNSDYDIEFTPAAEGAQ